MGVSNEQFIDAVSRTMNSDIPVHKEVVEKLLSIEDFIAFKKVMVKRNNELNKKSLTLYEEQKSDQVP